MPDAYAGRLGTAATAAASPSPVAAAGKLEEGPSAEEKETDAAAVTAVIWKELAEMSAAQAKLKVSQLSLPHLSYKLAGAAVVPACIMTGHSGASFLGMSGTKSGHTVFQSDIGCVRQGLDMGRPSELQT